MLKDVSLPDLGNITSATVIEIPIKAGASINKEDTLLTLESEKASMDIPSPYTGTVKEVKVKINDTVKTGSIVAIMEVAESEGKPAASPAASNEKPAASQPEADKKSPATVAVTTSPAAAKKEVTDVYAGPTVRRLARELDVNLAEVPATGPKGRISKEDLKNFVKSGKGGSGFPAPPVVDFTPFGPTETQALTRIKRLTAVNLHRNWVLVPHVTQFDEADVTELEEFRKSQQPLIEKDGFKLTLLPFIMKAVVHALKEYPTFNASLDPSGEKLILKKYFHIGVAVDTMEGLVVPVIRDVDKKGLLEIAKELATVSTRARAKGLTPADMQGSSFTISSLGGIGGTAFTPIVNLPDVAILGVSKSSIKPIYQEGQFVPRLMLPLSLSYDHRVIDGAEGARFIVYLSSLLADMRRWAL